MIETNFQEWEEYDSRLLDDLPVGRELLATPQAGIHPRPVGVESASTIHGPFLLGDAGEITGGENLIPSKPTHSDIIDDAFKRSRAALVTALGHLKRLRDDLGALPAASDPAFNGAFAKVLVKHKRNIAVLAKRLKIVPPDPSGTEFRDKLNKVIDLCERNLALSKSIVDTGRTGVCDPSNPCDEDKKPYFACTVADQPDPKTRVCESFFQASKDLQRDVITHEYFHQLGLTDIKGVDRTDKAMRNANTIAQIVALLTDRSRQRNSDGQEPAVPPLPTDNELPEFEIQEQSESHNETEFYGKSIGEAQEVFSSAHSSAPDPYAGIRSALAPEHASLEANELTVILGGKPAILALYQIVNSPEMRQATMASLLGKSARKTVRHNGQNISLPAYLRIVSRLCREAAAQSETESRDEAVHSGDRSYASESWLNVRAEASESESSAESAHEGPQNLEVPRHDEKFRSGYLEGEQPSAGERSSSESESSSEQFFESEIDGANLKWSGASQDQLDFMRAVYARHVANAQARRTFIADVPASDLRTVENEQRLRTEAASNCVTLLADVRAALATAQNAGDALALEVNRINVVSGYRSASQQFSIWQNNFPKYYSQTAAHRSSLSSGAHGSEAISFQASYVGNRVAAPGFSNHNDGRAIDFGADLTRSRRLSADSSTASISLWRSSWLFQWLSSKAANYGFFQNTAINEPWHWEYRGTSEISPAQESDVTVVSSGNIYCSKTTLLSKHRGTQPDLYVCWNYASVAPSSVDVVVHLHGHSSQRAKMLLTNKVSASGLDFTDPAGVGGGRIRPSVGIIPRGDYAPRAATKTTAANPDVYGFPALVGKTAMSDLITFGFGRFTSAVGASGSVSRNRFILTCHSGGGDWLGSILPNIDPDEIHLFDAIYITPPALLAWIDRHVASDDAGKPGTSAFRMFYTSKEFTTPNDKAIAIATRVRTALQKATNTQALAPYFKVEWTTVGHPDIPRTYGWQLLADASAKVSQTRQLSPP